MPYDRLLGKLRTGTTGGGGGTVTDITAGTGLTATPNPVVASGTVELNINGLTTETTLAAGDLFPFLDVSVGTAPSAQRKVTLANLAAAVGTGGTVTSISAGTGITLTPNPITTTGTVAVDTKLAAFDALGGTGIVVQTGAATFAVRSIVQPAAGITVTNGSGVAGNPTLALADDLAAVEALATTGLATRTGTSTWTTRSLVQPAAGITITNPAGIAGDPTFALANDLAALEAMSGTGLVTRTASETYAQRTIVKGTSNTTGSITNGDGVSGNPTINFPDPGLFVEWGYQPVTTSDYTSLAPTDIILGMITASTLTSATYTANILRAWPFIIGRDCTLTGIRINVNGGAAAGRHCRIGIYGTTSRTQPYPNTRVYGSTDLDCSTTGTKGDTGLSVTLNAGTLYWATFVVDNGSISFNNMPLASVMPIGFNVAGGIISPVTAVTRTFTYAALPDPWGTAGSPSGLGGSPMPAILITVT